MFTLTIYCVLYFFSWIISWKNPSFGKACLAHILPICFYTCIAIFIYSFIVNILFLKRFSKYNKLPIIKNFFGIIVSICLVVYLLLGQRNTSILLVFIVLAIILYWYIFIKEIKNNHSNFFLMLPFFVRQEFKSLFLMVVTLFCIPLTLIQLALIPISILGSIGGSRPYFPYWKDLILFKFLLN